MPIPSDVEISRFITTNFARDVRPDQLDPDLNLLDTGVVTSLGLLRLVAWVGETYRIPVEDMDISPDQFSSVAAIREFVAAADPKEGAR